MITFILAALLIATGAIIVMRGAVQMVSHRKNLTDLYASGLRVAAGFGLVGIGQALRLLLQINGKL